MPEPRVVTSAEAMRQALLADGIAQANSVQLFVGIGGDTHDSLIVIPHFTKGEVRLISFFQRDILAQSVAQMLERLGFVLSAASSKTRSSGMILYVRRR
jgi:hypothetical protein